MEDFTSYLPAIITALIITPLGGYVAHRLKALATKEDFNDAIEQLKKSTKAVESIKSQMNEKYWVKQQIWETKRVAYEELTSSLYITQKYLDGLVAYFESYVDCFVHIGCSQGAPYESPEEEEHQRSYAEYIEGEQKAFNEKYESLESKNERESLLNEANDSFVKLENIFSIKSIYLHADLKSIESDRERLREKVFNAQLEQEEYEHQSEFFDRLLEHYLSTQKSLSDLVEKTKGLAVKDLRLEFDGVST
ncbi:hypothetical protein AB6D15_23660 [Vibrio splendidus]